MKTLVLMRHAKTEAANPAGDKARRLVPRGRQDAQEAGAALARLGIDFALVSSATRTRETFNALGLGIEPVVVDELYYGGTETAIRLLAAVPDHVAGVVLVGHAPTIPALVAELSRASVDDNASNAHHFPTASYTVFRFPGSWADLAHDAPRGLTCEGVQRP